MEQNEKEVKNQNIEQLSEGNGEIKDVSCKKEKCSSDHPSHVSFLLVLIFGVLLGLGIAGGVMLLIKDNVLSYDKKSQRETTAKTESDTEKNPIVEMSEEDISNYGAIIEYFNNHYGNQYPLEISSFSNKNILWTSFSIGNVKKIITYRDSFSKDLMKNMVQYVYGADVSYTDEDIPCPVGDGVLYRFNDNQYSFAADVLHGHGGEGSFQSKFYFLKGFRDDDNNTMEIQGKVLYGNYCGSTCGPIMNFYKEANLNPSKGLYDTDGEYDQEDFDVAYQKFKDQLPVTTFTFKKDSVGGYGLKKITLE